MAAVKQDWGALKFASLELRGDRDIVMVAVKDDGWNIDFAS